MAKKKKLGNRQLVPESEPPSKESFLESTPSSQPVAQRPKTSPYTSSPVAICIGPEYRKYYVPRDLLQNPGWIASFHSWDNNVSLPDVDESTGHVLVHYLYTGDYQTLDDMETTPVGEVNIEFKRAVLAYIMAKKYELHGLQQLAKHKIEQFGAEMSILDIIEATKKDFSKLPGDAAWFYDYLNGKAKVAFAEDHTVFARDDLFGRIDDIALTRLLAKCVVELYNNKVSRMLNTEREPVPGISEECIPGAQDLPIGKASAEESFAIEEIFAEDCPAEDCPVLVCSTEDYLSRECPIEDCPVEDCLVEEARVEEPCVEEPCVEEPCIEEPCIEEPCVEEPCVEEPCVEEPCVEELCVEEAPVEAPVQEAFTEEPVADEPKIDMSFGDVGVEAEKDDGPWLWDLYSYSKKKKKKKGKGKESEPVQELEPELEPVVDDLTIVQKVDGVEEPKAEEEIYVRISNGHSDPRADSEGEMCPVRVKHLLEGGEWESCRQCRATLRQVALQLAHVGHADEDRYETVDHVLMK